MNKGKSVSFVLLGIALVIVLIGSFFLFNGSFTRKVIEDKKSLKIGVIVYPGFAPFFIAEEKGFFKKEGVNAEVVLINDPVQGVSALASGDVDMLFNSADTGAIMASENIKFKQVFAADIGYGADGLLVKNNVNSMQDLKGKTVYLATGLPSHFLFRYVAKKEGLTREDVNIVQMDADQVGTAFLAGRIDYGMTWEPWLSKAQERKDSKILFSSKDYPGIITDTFVARDEVVQSRRDDVKAVTRAWFDSIEFIQNNPEEADAIMARRFSLSTEDFNSQVKTVKFLNYEENLKKFDKNSDLNIFELRDLATEIYREDGVIHSNISSESVIDPSILQDLYN